MRWLISCLVHPKKSNRTSRKSKVFDWITKKTRSHLPPKKRETDLLIKLRMFNFCTAAPVFFFVPSRRMFFFLRCTETHIREADSIGEEMVQFFTKCPRSWFDFENFARSGPKSGSVFCLLLLPNPTVVVVLVLGGCIKLFFVFLFSSPLLGFSCAICCCPTLEDSLCILHFISLACSWFCSYVRRHKTDESNAAMTSC